ncbi:hypothetical protein K438DRAFT_1786671 [Mycena galopus ATCC 62051]|nr:hypothetical protein K438DRAFT_1786671 [Mycena galopus ATCC 62051]
MNDSQGTCPSSIKSIRRSASAKSARSENGAKSSGGGCSRDGGDVLRRLAIQNRTVLDHSPRLDWLGERWWIWRVWYSISAPKNGAGAAPRDSIGVSSSETEPASNCASELRALLFLHHLQHGDASSWPENSHQEQRHHPADNAGVGKKTRRSSAQVKQACDDEETARKKDKLELDKKMRVDVDDDQSLSQEPDAVKEGESTDLEPEGKLFCRNLFCDRSEDMLMHFRAHSLRAWGLGWGAIRADAPTGSPKPPKFKLNTPEGRATFVEWCLQTAPGGGTFAFHRKTWGNGVDKNGFLQSHIILHALAYHLTCLEAIPGGYERLVAHPESALLLATQAVHHELQFWRSGEYVNPNKLANFFSADNYDDTIEFVQTADGEKKQKRTRRATKFLSTIRGGWDDDQWKEIIQAARSYMELPGRKRAQTISRSGSEVEDEPLLSDDDVAVLSD